MTGLLPPSLHHGLGMRMFDDGLRFYKVISQEVS